jgi:arginine decarboxylase
MRRIEAIALRLSMALLVLLIANQAFAESVQMGDDSGAISDTLFGNRIPKHYFVTSGSGDTDIGPGDDPWETGSYDLALMEAGIANFNVVPYTSVLPPESMEIPIDEAQKFFHHGAVIEVIMASVNGEKGEMLCTGVGRIQVRRISDGEHIGGFAAEYEKRYDDSQTISIEEARDEAEKMLNVSLMGECERRYSSDEYDFFDENFTVNCFEVQDLYGTSLVALCWVSYIYPQLDDREFSSSYTAEIDS